MEISGEQCTGRSQLLRKSDLYADWIFEWNLSGSGVIVARFFGAGDEKNLQRAVHTTVAFGLVAGVLMTGVGVALLRRSCGGWIRPKV